jgi:hypothetical protein
VLEDSLWTALAYCRLTSASDAYREIIRNVFHETAADITLHRPRLEFRGGAPTNLVIAPMADGHDAGLHRMSSTQPTTGPINAPPQV